MSRYILCLFKNLINLSLSVHCTKVIITELKILRQRAEVKKVAK